MFCLLVLRRNSYGCDRYLSYAARKKVPNAVEVVVKVKSIFWKLSQNAFSKVKNGCNLQMTFIFFNVVVNSFLANYICSFVTFFFTWPINLCYLSSFSSSVIRNLRELSSFLTGPKINNCQKEVANYPTTLLPRYPAAAASSAKLELELASRRS